MVGPGATPQQLSSTDYRDLLLMCTNALVFFPRGSLEHSAATRTRALVDRHMFKDQLQPSGKATGPPAAAKKAKAEADVGSLLEKTTPIVVCRKRSSVAKAAAATVAKEKAKMDDKEEVEAVVSKRKPVARGPRTNKTHGSPTVRKEAVPAVADNGSGSDTLPKDAKRQPAADKKGDDGGVAKKRNAVNFLKRIKQGRSASSTERVSLLETLKLSAAAEQKKAGKGEGEKEPAGGSGSGSRPRRGGGTLADHRNARLRP